VVKVICQKGRIVVVHEWVNPIRQVSPMCAASNTWFIKPTRVRNHNPNGISIGSAVFAWLTIMTDRQSVPTDHATPSVTIGHIYMYVA